MKSKNHRLIPKDELWRPSIHESAPDVAPMIIASVNRQERGPNAKKRVSFLCAECRAQDPVRFGNKSNKTIVKEIAVHLGCHVGNGARKKERLLRAFLYGEPTPKVRPVNNWVRKPKPKSENKWTFYESREWMEVRYKAIKLHGRRCLACGTTDGEMHVDHVKPRSKFPELELELSNLQVLCRACNLGKGAWDQTDWRSQ